VRFTKKNLKKKKNIRIPLFVAAYIFTAPTCKATIISLESCALNADFQSISFPDLIKFPYFMDTSERRV